ncbi:hypothetical protein IIM_01012 [Bacillus cereus VD107]|nr:hypothetical protein IIM_01012 [Bacillus cereus VD107]
MEKAILKIEAMTCGGCANKVKKALLDLYLEGLINKEEFEKNGTILKQK